MSNPNTSADDDTSRLIQDINGSGDGPTLGDLSNALAKGNVDAVQDFEKQNGYALTPQSVEKALSRASVGPGFDIRMGKCHRPHKRDTS